LAGYSQYASNIILPCLHRVVALEHVVIQLATKGEIQLVTRICDSCASPICRYEALGPLHADGCTVIVMDLSFKYPGRNLEFGVLFSGTGLPSLINDKFAHLW
jgi:hypothetical protein